jgi:hypothetical protein
MHTYAGICMEIWAHLYIAHFVGQAQMYVHLTVTHLKMHDFFVCMYINKVRFACVYKYVL